jgi:hypothetical protein
MGTESKIAGSISAAASFFLIVFIILPALSQAGEGFQQVYDNLDLKKNTKLHAKEYWKGVEGKEVSWSGAIFDVRGGRGKAQVFVANSSRTAHRGYNIVLVMHDMEKAAKLKKGQKIRFRGNLHDYDLGRQGGVVLTLTEAEIL